MNLKWNNTNHKWFQRSWYPSSAVVSVHKRDTSDVSDVLIIKVIVFWRKKILNSEQLWKIGKLAYIIDLKPIFNIRRHQLENGLSVSILMEISITGFSYSSVYESLNPKDIIHCLISISAKARGLTGCNCFFSKYCWSIRQNAYSFIENVSGLDLWQNFNLVLAHMIKQEIIFSVQLTYCASYSVVILLDLRNIMNMVSKYLSGKLLSPKFQYEFLQ